MNWWKIDTTDAQNAASKPRAVAYYRRSAQDRQEDSISRQREQVRQWADENGVEIIHEFADIGESGLNPEDRPAFTEMMDEWVRQRNDFTYVLCLDVSRWGRFQDINLLAQYCAECERHGKQVIYTDNGLALLADCCQQAGLLPADIGTTSPVFRSLFRVPHESRPTDEKERAKTRPNTAR